MNLILKLDNIFLSFQGFLSEKIYYYITLKKQKLYSIIGQWTLEKVNIDRKLSTYFYLHEMASKWDVYVDSVLMSTNLL